MENPVAAVIEKAEASSPREGARRRGRRGGRKEREHRENATQNATMAPNGAPVLQQSFDQMDTAPVSPVPINPSQTNNPGPTEYIAFPEGFDKPSEYIAMPSHIASPVIASLGAIAKGMPASVPKISVNGQDLVQSDLIQIETDPVKIGSVEQIASTPEKHTPRRRERQREVYVESEPLVQIETEHSQG